MFKRFFHGFVLLAFLAGMLVGTPVQTARAAAIIYVDVNAVGSNNGSSWANAYTSLPSAVTSSVSGDQIWVAAGTYKPTTTMNRTISFTLKIGVTIYGGFVSGASSLSERDPDVNVTILSGDIGTPGDASDNSYHVVYIAGTNNTAVLDGFTITGGNANGVSSNADGGGVYGITGNSPSLINVIISANHADDAGGGMHVFLSSSAVLTNVTFVGNSAGGYGGGLYDQAGNPTLTDVTFDGNTSNNLGGGMYVDSGNPTLTNVTFKNNAATTAGGGMRNIFGNPTLTNVTFSGNSAPEGGGMQNVGSNPILTNATFSGNTAGGAIYNVSSGNPMITNSIVYGNTGGEIVNDSSTPVVTYSIVQGGYAGAGNLSGDPLLGPLQDNGGFTQTMKPGAGSPAINKGQNSTCAATDQRGIARPQGPRCDIGAVEIEMLSLTLRSVGANDGWTLESTETSGKGGTMNSASTTFRLGDGTADKQYRSILHFNTASLPDTAVITRVTLKIRKQGLTVGADPFTILGALRVDIRKPFFGAGYGLALGDFQALATKNSVGTIPNAPVSGWYSKSWTSGIFSYINLTGPTQFRLRFATDDNDDNGADYMKFYSGNYAGVASRPTIVIVYYVP